jgi:hypothetical protein
LYSECRSRDDDNRTETLPCGKRDVDAGESEACYDRSAVATRWVCSRTGTELTAPTFTSYGAIGTSAMVYVISGAVVIEIFAVPALYAAWRGR